MEDQLPIAEALTHKPHNIVIGQQVDEGKVVLARQMRLDMTPGEARLWARLRRGALGSHFRRQQVIAGFIADFYCREAALAVEVDGATHDAAYDAERDRVFAEHGVAVLRFTNTQVRDEIGVVLYTIRQALRAKGDKPPERVVGTYPGASADPPETGR